MEPDQHDADTSAVQDLFRAVLEGWNTGSGERFAAPFTDPCDFIAFDGTHLTSREQIATVHQELFDKWLRGTRLTGDPQVRFLTPDVALIVARGDTIMRGKSKPAAERASIQTLTAVRTADGWRFVSFQNTRVRLIGQNGRSALVWLATDKLWKVLGGRQTTLRT
jgi:uncharacterized protein (TIGR02246 family)